MGGSSGGGGSTKTETKPWEAARPYLKEIMGQGQQLYGQPVSLAGMTPEERLQSFKDTTGTSAKALGRATGLPMYNMISSGVMPFTEGEQGSMDLLRSEADKQRFAGIGLTEHTARGQNLRKNPFTDVSATGAGQFLSPETNPWLEQTYQAAADPLVRSYQEQILPALRSQFTMSGHGAGGPGEQFEAEDAASGLTRSLSNLSAGIYGPAYQMERQLQEQALGRQQEAYGMERGMQEQAMARAPMMGLQLQTGALRNAEALGQVGSAERGLGQQYAGLIQQAQQDPWMQLQNYQQAIQPSLAFNTQSQPYYQNGLAGALGGAASGAGAGMMVGGPWGAAIGGGLGLGAGLFF